MSHKHTFILRSRYIFTTSQSRFGVGLRTPFAVSYHNPSKILHTLVTAQLQTTNYFIITAALHINSEHFKNYNQRTPSSHT